MSAHPGFRADIQALRGFAVLIVLFYHAGIKLFPAGYLGVDVFFVISGFLITQLIKGGIEAGTFRFSTFYFRRAKRLLPAAYVTFLGTALLAPLFLTTAEMSEFRKQMAGALSFSANFVLLAQSGYFDGSAELKPLLHTWSLAIEEQYYFIVPALMVFVPRRFWLRGTLLLLVCSLALCLYRQGLGSTFYLLPTRAWELCIGSMAALLPRGVLLAHCLRWAFWPAVLTLLALPLIPSWAPHPGVAALLICLATAVIILRAHPLLSRGAAISAVAGIGDISYSLYLVHWPLFAYLSNAWIGESGAEPPLAMRVVLIVLSLVLAYMLNRFVEEPVRQSRFSYSRALLAKTLATTLGLVALTNGIASLSAGDRDYKQIMRHNYGLAKQCAEGEGFDAESRCKTSESPRILVWGDSYAMHLVPGLLQADGGSPSLMQATRSGCGPFPGFALAEDLRGRKTDPAAVWRCIRFNESVLSYLQRQRSIEIVVLSSPLKGYVDPQGRLWKAQTDGALLSVPAGMAGAYASLKAVADGIRAMGKRVVLVAPPPAGGFDAGICNERLERGLPTFGVDEACSISLSAYRRERGVVLDFLESLPASAGIPVISFDPFLCDEHSCRTRVDGRFIFRDSGHLSHEGSELLANRVDLMKQIENLAR